jgi:hypothetical protein
MFIKQSLMTSSSVLTGHKALRTARQTIGDGLASCMAAKLNIEQGRQTDQSQKDV